MFKVLLKFFHKFYKNSKINSKKVLRGGEAVTTPTFQLGGAGSTPIRDIKKTQTKTIRDP